jgi:hypothetical protein
MLSRKRLWLRITTDGIELLTKKRLQFLDVGMRRDVRTEVQSNVVV